MHHAEESLYRQVASTICDNSGRSAENLAWLQTQMDPYFSITMHAEVDAIANLAMGLQGLAENQRLILADRKKTLILARLNLPGSLYDTLQTLHEKEISYAQFTHSTSPVPGLGHELEVQRFDFDRKEQPEISRAAGVAVPAGIRERIVEALSNHYPRFDLGGLDDLLGILWLNNEEYVRVSPPKRVAKVLQLFQQGNRHGGLYLDVELSDGPAHRQETKVMFAVGNPPQRDFLIQIMEVFKRLELGVTRAYCLTLSTGTHPYFLGTFYVRNRMHGMLSRGSELFERLQRELYNTQILSVACHSYRELVTKGVMSGEDGSLVNAFISFCHTNLSHHHPSPFGLEEVMRAFHSHADIAQQLLTLFKSRFEPGIAGREGLYAKLLAETRALVAGYSTGHRYLDEIRRTIFSCCVTFIRHTLKTNFFITQKHALAFRLDPAYLSELPPACVADIPATVPFRITFFFGRYGAGYHIGFSDIARGGWRTVITHNRDDYVTSTGTLFREVYVLAQTQHAKNKDIYEGGSKLVAVLDAADLKGQETINQRLYKFQLGFTSAFLDVFVTLDGSARDPRVVDYYGEDEPIELGPDENMHDVMIETIARQSLERGYLLGIGIMSGKRVGINHKQYGVTSLGVVKFVEITMRELGIDIRREPFSVKFTGGPNGDVAGNALRLLLERCPQVKIKLILDGTGAVFDPHGVAGAELGRLLLKHDLDDFDPRALHAGGFILYQRQQKTDGLRTLYQRTAGTASGPEEQWVTMDEFHREFGELLFSVPTDLFVPAGGRPETVDKDNWHRFLGENGRPNTRAIVEGANSFITPEARIQLQRRGVVIMRDCSANKCGVISSSYEIIGNLLLSEQEFLDHKERYVDDVLEILERRAEDEARLIFRRKREPGCELLYTEISDAISREINGHYSRLFELFQLRPRLCARPLFRRMILKHLPRLIREEPVYSRRIENLPAKYQHAILAATIASSRVYGGDGRHLCQDTAGRRR